MLVFDATFREVSKKTLHQYSSPPSLLGVDFSHHLLLVADRERISGHGHLANALIHRCRGDRATAML